MSSVTDGLLVHPTTEKSLEAYLASPVHAVLLAGHEGLGKTLLAQRLAYALLGVEKSTAEQPYIRVLQQEKQVIPIEQVRGLHEFFARKVPGKQALKRVVIIPDADTLTLPAQNALLKLLEEPPADSVFVLTSSKVRGLLPTITSRVQHIDIHTPSESTLIAYFAAYPSDEVAKALLLNGPNIARLSTVLAQPLQTDTMTLVKQVLASSTYERLLILGKLAQDREGATQFVDTLNEIVGVTLRNSATKSSAGLDRWRQMQTAAFNAAASLRKNANVKLVMTELAVSL